MAVKPRARDALFRAALLVIFVLHTLVPHCAAQDNSVAPVITAIFGGCPLDTDNVTLVCQQPLRYGPLTIFTIAGYNFGNIRGVLVNVSGANFFTQTTNPCNDGRSCVQVNVPNYPVYGSGGTGGVLPINVVQPNSGSASVSNTVYGIRFQPIPRVTLTAISGCTGRGLTTDGCVIGGNSASVLTLTGSGFQADKQPILVAIPAYDVVSNPSSVNDTSVLTFSLARIAAQLPSSAYSSPTGIAVCVLHGVTLSNCLSISLRANTSSPMPPAATAVATSSAISVTAVSGCPVNSSNTATRCRLPAALTISGAGFNVNATVVTIGGVLCDELVVINAETVTCTFPNVATPAPVDTQLEVVVLDATAMRQSAPFLGMSYTTPVPIIVTSVSGCRGDSSSSPLETSGCDPNNGTLTIRGSGFQSDVYSWYSRLGSVVGTSDYGNSVDLRPYIVDEQTIVIPFDDAISSYMRLSLYLNSTMLLCPMPTQVDWENARMPSACPVFSFAVPEPVISSVVGCNGTTSSALATTGCTSGQSILTISGSDLGYPVTVTVAGQPAGIISAYIGQPTIILLPVIVGLEAGIGYDVVLSNPLYSVTVPGAVSFAPTPVLSTITSQYCVTDPQTNQALLCPAGAVLTLVGSYFSSVDNITVLLTPASPVGSPAVACLGPAFDSSSVLTCVLPPPPSALSLGYNVQWSVVVQEVGSSEYLLSNLLQTRLYWNATGEPHIDSVTGCLGADAVTRGVVQCSPGNVVTLQGSNFVNSTGTVVNLYILGALFICQQPTVLSATQLTCVLPFVLESTPSDVLPVRISGMNGLRSNWLSAINYQATMSNPTQAQSSSSTIDYQTRFAAALGVLLPLVLLSLALNGALLYGRVKQGKGSSWTSQRDSSSEVDTQMARYGGSR